jgi:hypothetical protein
MGIILIVPADWTGFGEIRVAQKEKESRETMP